MKKTFASFSLSHTATLLITLIGGVFILIIAKKILIPMVLAMGLAYIIITMTHEFRKEKLFGRNVPVGWAYLCSIVVVVGVAVIMYLITRDNISILIDRLPFYRDQLIMITDTFHSSTGIDVSPWLIEPIKNIDVNRVGGIIGSVTKVGTKTLLVLLYTVFILLEYPSLRRKVAHFFSSTTERMAETKTLLDRVAREVNTYFRIRILMSFLSAFVALIIMWAFNIDLALFWALLIFVFNFIPTIGSIIAVAFPSALAIVQFGGFGVFIPVVILLAGTQFLVDSVIEPRIAGKMLDLSSLAIIIGLVIGGFVWGIAGMLISVPVLIILKILSEELDSAKTLSLLLSRTGKME